jgi:tetratricopeptide (TPR) repeat protein
MSKAKAINHLVRLAGAIIKHQLGDGTIAKGAEYLSEYAGEELAEKFEEFAKGQDIESAFSKADKIFEENCSDDHVKQAIHELPLAGSSALLAVAKKLPKTYASEKLLSALIKTLKTYWGKVLSEDQIEQAAHEYQLCLERSLAIIGQPLLATFIKVERIDLGVYEILKNQVSFQITIDSLRKDITERLPISNQTQPTRYSNAGLDIELADLNKDELQLNAQLDQCKLLLDMGSPNAASKLLNKIEQSATQKNTSDKIWFRLKTLQGGCAIGILEDEKAAKLFEDAYHRDPTNPKAISNLAVARFIQKEYAEAITLAEHVIAIDPNESSAYSIWVTARAQRQGFKNLDELVKEGYFNRSDYLRALGLAFYDADEYAQAVEYLHLALKLDQSNRFTKLALVTALITYETVDNKRSSRYLVGDQIEVGDSLKEAAVLVNELIAEFESGDSLPLVLDAKAFRGAIRGLSGDRAGAKNDCDDVLRENPNHVNALCNRIIISRMENDFDYLLTLAERVPSKVFANDVQMVHLVASAYIQKQNFDKALALTNEFCGKYKRRADNYECTVIQAWILYAAGKEKDARNLIADLLNNADDFVLALENAAFFENLIGSISSAIDHLNEMYEKADPDRKRSIALKLAHLHLQNQNPVEAIEWLDREEIDITQNIELARIFLPALYANQQFERAYKDCQKLRESNIKEPYLLEIEAHIAEMLGNLELAYELDTELVNLVPDQAQHQVNRARLCMRTDQEKEAKVILESIDPRDIHNPYILIQLAQMYMLANEPQKTLDTIFLARRLGIENPKIHEAYFSLFLQIDDEIEGLDPNEVAAETSVLLVSDEQEQWISISADKNIDAKAWEFSPKSDLAQLLMGRKVGEPIELDSDQFGEPMRTIGAIQSKYVRAFQETLSEFNIRFPKNNSIQKIPVENEDVTPFLTKVAGMSMKSWQMLDSYKQGQFTIGQLSSSIGHNRLDTFLGLLADENDGPYASLGFPADQQYQKNALRSANEITIDLTALLTLSYLDMLDLLPKRFSKLFIPHHLLDELNQILIDRKFQLKKGYSTVGYNGTNFFFIEVPKDEIENRIKQLLDLKTFIQNNCTVTSISPKYLDQIAQILNGGRDNGLISMANIIIADQTQTPIFADDVHLRAIAQVKVPGFWSQIFLEDLKLRRIISPELYADACIKLRLAGYRYTSVNLETISLTLGKYNYQTNRYTLAVINALRPDTTENTAIGFATLVIADLWSSPTPIDLKFNMLDNFLRALTAGRDSDLVLIKLMEALRPRLHDSQYKEVIKQIRLYAEVIRQVGKN